MTLTIATRGSQLATWQARFVQEQLQAHGLSCEQLIIKTQGDKIQDRFLHEIGGKGVFIKGLEAAMMEGQADIAVHSLKDMPVALPKGFCLGAILPRHAVRDLLILHPKHAGRFAQGQQLDIEALKSFGPATIATGSLRRQALLRSSCPEIKLAAVRGNVDTRIKKLLDGPWDGIILAEAAIERLQLTGLITQPLDPEWFVPSPAQGALAIECREDHPVCHVLSKLDCLASRKAVELERRVLEKLGGDCTMPIGCHSTAQGEGSRCQVKVLDYTGRVSEAVVSWPQRLEALDIESAAHEVLECLYADNLQPVLTALEQAPPDLGRLE